jgi:proline iminopeptidase
MVDLKEPSSWNGSVSVDGATLRYVLEGSGIPTLVIGSAIYYPRTFSQQLRKTLRLVFMDVRHFAEIDTSCSPDKVTLDTYTNDIEQVRTKLGFERVVVIGHSHHGNLALEYAKRYPERVSHLVLIGSPPSDVKGTIKAANAYWSEHASEARKAALRDNWAALSPEVLNAMPPGDAYIVQYVADGPKYWYNTKYNASSLWQDVPVNMEIIKGFRDLFTDYELSWSPTRLRAPVLVVMGRHDYAVPHTLWDEVRPKLRNLTFHLFERSGHTPQLEEPKLFDQVLLNWIRKNSALGDCPPWTD